MAFSMYPGLTRGLYSAIGAGRKPRSRSDLYLPKLASVRMGRDHEPDRAAVRHGPRVAAHQGGSARRRDLQNLRPEDLDFGRRAGPDREHRPPGGWPASRARQPGPAASAFSWCRSSSPTRTGSPGERNSVKCLGLEEKMGIHGNATCVINHEEATGWPDRRGEPRPFDHVRHDERGAGSALWHAGDRPGRGRLSGRRRLRQGPAGQGRFAHGPKNPDGPADPIIGHPDVRRMLMDAKAMLDGRPKAFLFWTALHGDLADVASRRTRRSKPGRATTLHGADDPGAEGLPHRPRLRRSPPTPCEVHGGSGFTEHFPVSQYLRDCRIALIYEGANGIQALDLGGPQAPAAGRRARRSWASAASLDAFVAVARRPTRRSSPSPRRPRQRGQGRAAVRPRCG